MIKKKNVLFAGIFGLVFLLTIGLTFAVHFTDTRTTSYINEDQVFVYNFSANATNDSGNVMPLTFSILNFTSSIFPIKL